MRCLLHTRMDINWDRCRIFQESTKEDLRSPMEWFNGTSIYRTLLENVVEFRKEDCFPVAIRFDIEITKVVKMQSSSNPVPSRLELSPR